MVARMVNGVRMRGCKDARMRVLRSEVVEGVLRLRLRRECARKSERVGSKVCESEQ